MTVVIGQAWLEARERSVFRRNVKSRVGCFT
jgi:hypothetical protein